MTTYIFSIVSKGISANLMKDGAKRRRTKEEIKREKLAEEERLADINQKVQQFERMQAELDELRAGRDQYANAEAAVQNLQARGMVRFLDGNQIQPVQSWEESQQLLQQMADDQALAERLAQENQQLNQNTPHRDRRRAGNMLEAISEYNSNCNGGLRESVVMINHQDLDVGAGLDPDELDDKENSEMNGQIVEGGFDQI